MVNHHNHQPGPPIPNRWAESIFGNPGRFMIVASIVSVILFPKFTSRVLHHALNELVTAIHPFVKPLAEIAFAVILLLGALMLVLRFARSNNNNHNHRSR